MQVDFQIKRGSPRRCVSALLLALAAAQHCAAQPVIQRSDEIGDNVVRRVDGASGGAPVPAPHLMPDLVIYRLGRWQPIEPDIDLHRGDWDNGGQFFRLDLVFNGLINPPGPLAFPHLFGPSPVYGFFEVDMDADVDTGGELDLTHFRYLGAAARFGGVVSESRFAGRPALDACPGTFDGDIDTGPYFPERSGEDFHLFLIDFPAQSTYDVGSNGNFTFEPGETWRITGPFFQRAHGYEDVSYAVPNGSYIGPDAQLLYQHVMGTDRTTVSLVYPLTNAAAALARVEAVEPLDGDAANQNSVLEGLDDLVFSANFATQADRDHPAFPLIAAWEFKNAEDYLDPLEWRINAIFLGAFIDTDGVTEVLAFTDVFPNVLPGDLNGDAVVDLVDLNLFAAHLGGADGGPCDEDATVNDIIDIPSFGANFSVFDLDYDGFIDAGDAPTPPEDLRFDGDGDGDVDLADYALLQRCFGLDGADALTAPCNVYDDDVDGDIDLVDLHNFVIIIEGPQAAGAALPGGAAP